MQDAAILRIILAALAAIGIVAAVVLAVTDQSAAEAWGVVLALVGTLVGQHLDKP